jgi:hypothetical protein
MRRRERYLVSFSLSGTTQATYPAREAHTIPGYFGSLTWELREFSSCKVIKLENSH